MPMNNLLGTGIESIYVDNDFDEIEIRNHRGDIIGTENISKIVKKYRIGISSPNSEIYRLFKNMSDKVLCTFIPDYDSECYLYFEDDDGMFAEMRRLMKNLQIIFFFFFNSQYKRI